jgi:hypothetical protein
MNRKITFVHAVNGNIEISGFHWLVAWDFYFKNIYFQLTNERWHPADFPLKIGYDAPNTIKIRAIQLQSITQCNANTDLNFRLKFSKTTWPTETIYISFKSLFKDKFIDI